MVAITSRLKRLRNNIALFFKLLINNIVENQLTTLSASLAYTTILALVPLITVVFSLLAAFPIFAEASQTLKEVIYNNLVPSASGMLEEYIEQFISNTNKMTIFGIIGLIVTSLLLIRSIDSSLNIIWRTERKRSLTYNLTMYWTVLTLGPILIGASIAISSYIFSLKVFAGNEVVGHSLLSLLPFAITVIGFWLLYCIVPTESVPFKESIIGAVVAAILFDLGKLAFALYVTSFPTYQLIYGVISSIPLLLIWIYLSWCIILFGAELSVTLVDYNKSKKQPSKPSIIKNKVIYDRFNSTR